MRKGSTGQSSVPNGGELPRSCTTENSSGVGPFNLTRAVEWDKIVF